MESKKDKLTTWCLAGICLILAGATGSVWWYLAQAKISSGISGPVKVSLGLPDVAGAEAPRQLRSASALVWDSNDQAIRYEQNAFARRPLASLTKLMTAMVALDQGIDGEKRMAILPEENVVGGRLLLFAGETVSMRELLHASLMGSANNATLAYVRGLGIGKEEFVRAMNRKAVQLGLEQTEFVDVTGLDPKNVSTAYEVARLAEAAFNNYPEIAEITSKKEFTYLVGGSGREHTIHNTNKLMTEGGMELTGSKTGFLYEAGYCLVAREQKQGQDLIAVVMGSDSEEGSFSDIRALLQRMVMP